MFLRKIEYFNSYFYQQHFMFKLELYLTMIGILLAASSFFVGEGKKIFAWLYFLIPVLWLLWLCCAFVLRHRKSSVSLCILWLLIDLIPLLMLASFSVGQKNYYNSNGADLLVLVVYFPVIVPIIGIFKFFGNFIEGGALEYFGSSGLGGAICLWLTPTCLSALQSGMFLILVKLIPSRAGET